MWLEYVKEDYRELRKGTIGSAYQHEQNISHKHLPDFAVDINKKLSAKDATKAKSVAKYFLDIYKAISQAKKMLQKNGMAIFIIGNPKYQGVLVNNLKFFVFSMREAGFQNIRIEKEKSVAKILLLIEIRTVVSGRGIDYDPHREALDCPLSPLLLKQKGGYDLYEETAGNCTFGLSAD